MNHELIIPVLHLQKPFMTVLTITNKKKIGDFLIKVKMLFAHFDVFFHPPHTELLYFGEGWQRPFLEFPFWTQDSYTFKSCLKNKTKIKSLRLWKTGSVFIIFGTCHVCNYSNFLEKLFFSSSLFSLIFSKNQFTNATLILIDLE